MKGAEQSINILADAVQFRTSVGSTRWEFQYSFPDTTLTPTRTPTGDYEGELLCTLRLRTPDGDTITDRWIAAGPLPGLVFKHSRFFTGVRSFELPPGRYHALLNVQDYVNTKRAAMLQFDFDVRGFGQKIEMSDLMFTAPSAGDVVPHYTRNGVVAIPNPRHEFSGTDPNISVYFEVYQALANHADTLAVEFEVLDFALQPVLNQHAKLLGSGNGLVVSESIPAGALRTGVYTLNVRIFQYPTSGNTPIASRSERFYILNPELPPEGTILLTEEQRFLASEWAVCEGSKLKLELELSDVLATKAEKQTLAGLTDVRAQQRYLYRFWQSRDPDLSTPVNERLDEFRSMLKRAQAFYASPAFKDGWRSDRGRTLLKYGPPTQTTQHIQTIDTKPYEEWFYQGIQGGVYFYFVDVQGQANHKLVHSTMIGEVRNEKWFEIYAKAFEPDPMPTRLLTPTAR